MKVQDFQQQSRAFSMGNIYSDMHQRNLQYNQSCAVCLVPISLVDDYSFTYHPSLKYFCPTHKQCQKLLRRDSELVVVPKFELKAVSDADPAEIADKRPRMIQVDFQIMHPVTKILIFAKNDLSIKSTVLNNVSGITT